MLVLSRKVGEVISIGEGVFVTVVRIGPTAVGLGIDAPQDLHIHRRDKNGILQMKKPEPAPEAVPVPLPELAGQVA